MALVDNRQEILREVVEQAEWAHPGLASVEITAVILDAGAMAHLAYHLDIVGCARLQPVRLKGFTLGLEKSGLAPEVEFHLCQRRGLPFARGHKEICRINLELIVLAEGGVVDWMQRGYGVDFVAPEHHPADYFLISQAYIDRVALHPEVTSVQFYLVA